MRVLVPVDETSRYKSVLRFISRLKISNLELKLIHVVQPITTYDSSFMALSAINGADLTTHEYEEATLRLKHACEEADKHGLSATFEVCFGFPSSVICVKAHEYRADLVAIASIPKKPIERFLGGSVTLRIAADLNQDLLIVRTNQDVSEQCSVVYATDHSEGANECLDRLLSWHLGGIAHVEVLNAYEVVGHESAIAGKTEAISEKEVLEIIKSRISDKTEEAAHRVRRAGYHAHARSLEMPIKAAIRETMGSTGGNLLVLSAKGHNFWENIVVGSTSRHEIAIEPYSVLVLRPRTTAVCSTPVSVKQTAPA